MTVPRTAPRLLTVLAAGLLCTGAWAQGELEPRSYQNAPVGLNFLITGYEYVEGGYAADPSLPIEDPELTMHGPILGYSRSLGIGGKSAKIAVIVPYGSLSGSALLSGDSFVREVSGLMDPRLRLSVNLLGAPALPLPEFAKYRQNWIVGASLQVGVPLGQYDDTKVVNLGNNRFAIKPELGVSKQLSRWTIDLATSATFYTDNDDFPIGQTREQDPIYTIQAHLVRTLKSRIWLALDGTYYEGGAVTLNGAPASDSLTGSRLGVTLSLPVDRQNSVKLGASSGVSARTAAEYNAVTATWQYLWGGRRTR